MAASAQGEPVRHSILDLAPLELDCMNALWPTGEATVRQIQQALHPTRPRAYTTIMTILDRLAQKGIVERRKSGRAWVYRANLSADEARTHAVSQVIDGFFGGSAGALASHLIGQSSSPTERRTVPAVRPAAASRAEKSAPVQDSEPPQAPASASLDTALL
jgi:predicted transcriptional regulator